MTLLVLAYTVIVLRISRAQTATIVTPSASTGSTGSPSAAISSAPVSCDYDGSVSDYLSCNKAKMTTMQLVGTGIGITILVFGVAFGLMWLIKRSRVKQMNKNRRDFDHESGEKSDGESDFDDDSAAPPSYQSDRDKRSAASKQPSNDHKAQGQGQGRNQERNQPSDRDRQRNPNRSSTHTVAQPCKPKPNPSIASQGAFRANESARRPSAASARSQGPQAAFHPLAVARGDAVVGRASVAADTAHHGPRPGIPSNSKSNSSAGSTTSGQVDRPAVPQPEDDSDEDEDDDDSEDEDEDEDGNESDGTSSEEDSAPNPTAKRDNSAPPPPPTAGSPVEQHQTRQLYPSNPGVVLPPQPRSKQGLRTRAPPPPSSLRQSHIPPRLPTQSVLAYKGARPQEPGDTGRPQKGRTAAGIAASAQSTVLPSYYNPTTSRPPVPERRMSAEPSQYQPSSRPVSRAPMPQPQAQSQGEVRALDRRKSTAGRGPPKRRTGVQPDKPVQPARV